jgi:hypothetical protein
LQLLWNIDDLAMTTINNQDPEYALMLAVVKQAARDLLDDDVLTAFDATCWFLYGDGLIWLEAVGFDLTPERILYLIAEGRFFNAKKKRTRKTKGNASKDGRKRAVKIQKGTGSRSARSDRQGSQGCQKASEKEIDVNELQEVLAIA